MGFPKPQPTPWLKGAILAGNVFVVEHKATIIGVVCTTRTGDDLEIDRVCVDPDVQGQGAGAFAMGAIEDFARENGMCRMTLFTAEMMDDLLRFYARHGYSETHRALKDDPKDPHLRVHMEKWIM